ncbi:DEAD/DEAH box helicase [Cytobacillus horneckiae]|uniref:DEAD/DEAH box helicase n=1 Tax=Cytobacillus horneckiae TaxID=549687 RepID=UPI003D9A97DD
MTENDLIKNLNSFIQEVWNQSGFQKPTTIQEKTIPAVLEGKDLIAESPTGTGKTLAYLLPVLAKIDVEKKAVQTVILASSQELVMQILQEVQQWGASSGIRAASFIGGANVKRQMEKLKKHPHIAIGTPGRMLELIKQKKLKMHEVKTVVLDEGDQLLVREHEETVKNIVKATLSERQVLLFSATMPAHVEKVAKELMKDPAIIKVKKDETIEAEDVNHIYFVAEMRDKIKLLEKLSRMDGLKGLVFVKDIPNLTIINEKLHFNGIQASALHGELNKLDRQTSMKNFRSNQTNLLLSTDVAARGLDIKGITHVIHFDFPRDVNQYVHRSGRTGRFGASGTVISLVTNNEERDLKRFTKELGIQPVLKIMRGGQIVDPQPRR